eukprot:TRINITY_DN10085_c0_g1_i1.p1 TRINITY_DN10085_c0_g1~~TRINITY_DN10085_c0_g1_i1.p1  ORF type:complete len:193 (-),score=38.44 TRINITY_DN10085_c0_g1_i1:590-1168(-)
MKAVRVALVPLLQKECVGVCRRGYHNSKIVFNEHNNHDEDISEMRRNLPKDEDDEEEEQAMDLAMAISKMNITSTTEQPAKDNKPQYLKPGLIKQDKLPRVSKLTAPMRDPNDLVIGKLTRAQLHQLYDTILVKNSRGETLDTRLEAQRLCVNPTLLGNVIKYNNIFHVTKTSADSGIAFWPREPLPSKLQK